MNIERPKSRQPIPDHAKKVFAGAIFDVYQWEQEQFDGSLATFEKLKRDDSAVIIPTTKDRKLIIVEDEQPGRDAVLTFPGGRIEKGEAADEAAIRELEEETGFKPAHVELWKSRQPVSKVDWALYYFIGRGCEKVAEPKPDAGERITTREITFDEFMDLVEKPNFQGEDLRNDIVRCRFDKEFRAELEKKLFGE